MAPPRKPIKERILATIKCSGGCWIWNGSRTRDGYPVLTIGRQQHRAHRVSYQEFVGPIPHGLLVCHVCDQPLCVRPEHLFLGTARDNTRDMIAKGRRPDMSGHNRKIPVVERQRIRDLRASGLTLAAIAERYGVTFQVISDICCGRRCYAAGD